MNIYKQSINTNVLSVANSLRQFIKTNVQTATLKSAACTDERKLLEFTQQSLLQIANQLETSGKDKRINVSGVIQWHSHIIFRHSWYYNAVTLRRLSSRLKHNYKVHRSLST